ncbi:MAG TPA: T9SS type A sorting domain-containing protein [Bacteroidia bacterium]|nr:T9SS type A sorting domain-containing protein [Bacteroidia bacterium]
MKKLIFLLSLVTVNLFSLKGFSQASQIPFSIEIEPVVAGPMPGMHSFAFAQSGSKWLFVGGRTNGLHGFSTNDNFDVTYASGMITVIDTATWSVYTSTLGVLPTAEADPLRATNAQFTRIGDYLYIAGGFGWDSIAHGYRTFPVLTAIHVDNMINAVVNGTPIAPHIRQITDTNLRVCGGQMVSKDSVCTLFFGQVFTGRYSDPPAPTFTQTYTNEIKNFTISDDGTTMAINAYYTIPDTNNFHRRDLNVGPVVHPDGSFGWYAYSGVFQKDHEVPWPYPISYDATSGYAVDSSFSQNMNNYTCPMLPVFDSVQKNMYTVFFGGFSLNDYDPVSGIQTQDTLVPFVSDISVLVHGQTGLWAQVPLSLQMTGLQGGNMQFVPLSTVPSYSNDVVNLRAVGGRILAGYLVGGIVSSQPNLPPLTWANDTVYRVYITPDVNLLDVNDPSVAGTIDVFPNPANSNFTVRVHDAGEVKIDVMDAQGKFYYSEEHYGLRDANFSTSDLANGIYFVRVICGDKVSVQKLMIVR